MLKQNKSLSLILLYLVTSVFFVLLIACSSVKVKDKRNLTVLFCNVENLFDLVDEPGKDDVEFTPNGKNKWDQERYTKKLEDLSVVLSSVNEYDLPEIIGLCEVENEKVVSDLVKTGNLSKWNYKVIHYESPDNRGIDCALAYRPDEFKVTGHFPIPVKYESGNTTRNILYVKGETLNKEQFHLFVNHWPSRIEGLEKTEPRRIEVARQLKNFTDSVQHHNPVANIIIMGDMNDEPENKSLYEVLGAKMPGDNRANLVNLMFPDDLKEEGSYSYRGNWNMLDNLIVSAGLLDRQGFQCKEKKGFVFRREWMEYVTRDGQVSPNRTYGGPNYYGGVSDHFPVYFVLQY